MKSDIACYHWAGNASGIYQLGGYYAQGIKGVPQSWEKSSELWLKSGELGFAQAYHNLGVNYYAGLGVSIDKKKAKHFFELAAMNGHVQARHNLGSSEGQAGNHVRAYKHLIIAARAGNEISVDCVKFGFMNGVVTKDEYANTLRAYQKSRGDMKSDARDKAPDQSNQYDYP